MDMMATDKTNLSLEARLEILALISIVSMAQMDWVLMDSLIRTVLQMDDETISEASGATTKDSITVLMLAKLLQFKTKVITLEGLDKTRQLQSLQDQSSRGSPQQDLKLLVVLKAQQGPPCPSSKDQPSLHPQDHRDQMAL